MKRIKSTTTMIVELSESGKELYLEYIKDRCNSVQSESLKESIQARYLSYLMDENYLKNVFFRTFANIWSLFSRG